MKSTSAERTSAVGRSNSLRVSFYCHFDFIKCFTIRRARFDVQPGARNEPCHDSSPMLIINEAIDVHDAFSFVIVIKGIDRHAYELKRTVTQRRTP